MAARVEELETRIAEYQDEIAGLESEASAAEAQLLEREIRIAELEVRLDNQRLVLDETISEVVRTKAKLRGAESRAEAVSQMAEAEIALRGLADRPGGRRTEEYAKATELMEASGRAFEEENYGGAIYLVSQAKALITQGVTSATRHDIVISADETRFQRPFRLRALKNSNVRVGPGLEYRVISTVSAGTSLVGYSYTGEWIHVGLEDGRDGWIFRPLVVSGPDQP
ncbi:MAG: SH3 domain-containing protein [Gemmatimonadota bacterium]|nr:MAG: SH3 domain-containing protein [Gemmatimonadota bacterium]